MFGPEVALDPTLRNACGVDVWCLLLELGGGITRPQHASQAVGHILSSPILPMAARPAYLPSPRPPSGSRWGGAEPLQSGPVDPGLGARNRCGSPRARHFRPSLIKTSRLGDPSPATVASWVACSARTTGRENRRTRRGMLLVASRIEALAAGRRWQPRQRPLVRVPSGQRAIETVCCLPAKSER